MEAPITNLIIVCLLLAVFSLGTARAEPTGQDILKASQKAYDALTSYSDDSTAEMDQKGKRDEVNCTTRLLRPDFYKIEWTGTSPSGMYKGVCRSDGTASDITLDFGNSTKAIPPVKSPDLEESLDSIIFATGVPIAIDVPGIFFPKEIKGKIVLTAHLSSDPQSKRRIERQADERIGGTDCFTLMITDVRHVKGASGQTSDLSSTTQFSIGKQDYLVRRMRANFPGVDGEVTMTFTHRDVSVNRHLSPEDFSH